MRRSSWILLSVLVALVGTLYLGFSATLPATDIYSQQEANELLTQLCYAVNRKSVSGILDHVSPDPNVRVAGIRAARLRLLLGKAFDSVGPLNAQVAYLTTKMRTGDAVVDFDLSVSEHGPQLAYQAHITLELSRVETPVFLGLLHRKDWRIVDGQTTGPVPDNYTSE